MPLFTIQKRYKYYFSCCIFLYMCVFFLVLINPRALFSHALIYICTSFLCAFFLCAFFQCVFFFRSPVFRYHFCHVLVATLSALCTLRPCSHPQDCANANQGPRPNHRLVTEAPCLCKCKVTARLWHWEFYSYLVRASVRQQQLSYGWNASNSTYSFMYLWARTAGGHSLEERKETVAGVHVKNPISLTTLGEPITTPVTLKRQNQK